VRGRGEDRRIGRVNDRRWRSRWTRERWRRGARVRQRRQLGKVLVKRQEFLASSDPTAAMMATAAEDTQTTRV
jgi:hypothetical protein